LVSPTGVDRNCEEDNHTPLDDLVALLKYFDGDAGGIIADENLKIFLLKILKVLPMCRLGVEEY
jgi:hypothetical protein